MLPRHTAGARSSPLGALRNLRVSTRPAAAMSSGGGGRLQEALRSTPLVTLALFATCVAVFVADNLGSFYDNLALFALSPSLVVERGQVWRVATGAFLHGGLLHIGMNMLSLVGLGSALEPMFGTLQFACIQALYVVAVGALYVALCYAGSLALPGYQHTSAVGFSGVLFAMAMDEVSLSPFPTRSVYGLFSVPTALYPWVLMGLLQFLLPNVSLVGHLAGILVGLAHARGWLKWAVPSAATARRWEAAPWLARLVRLPGYRLAPATEVLRESAHTDVRAGGGLAWLRAALRPVTDCVARLTGGAVGGGGGAGSAPPTAAGAAATALPTSGSGRRMVVVDGCLVPQAAAAAGGGGGGAPVSSAATAPQLPPAPSAPAAGGGGGGGGGGGAVPVRLAGPPQPQQQHQQQQQPGVTLAVRPAAPPPLDAAALAVGGTEGGGGAASATPPPAAPAAASDASARAGLAALARLTAGSKGGYAKLATMPDDPEAAAAATPAVAVGGAPRQAGAR